MNNEENYSVNNEENYSVNNEKNYSVNNENNHNPWLIHEFYVSGMIQLQFTF